MKGDCVGEGPESIFSLSVSCHEGAGPFKTERQMSILDVANTTMTIYNATSMINLSNLREN